MRGNEAVACIVLGILGLAYLGFMALVVLNG